MELMRHPCKFLLVRMMKWNLAVSWGVETGDWARNNHILRPSSCPNFSLIPYEYLSPGKIA